MAAAAMLNFTTPAMVWSDDIYLNIKFRAYSTIESGFGFT